MNAVTVLAPNWMVSALFERVVSYRWEGAQQTVFTRLGHGDAVVRAVDGIRDLALVRSGRVSPPAALGWALLGASYPFWAGLAHRVRARSRRTTG
jgi:hypothetical protein